MKGSTKLKQVQLNETEDEFKERKKRVNVKVTTRERKRGSIEELMRE